MNKKSLEKAREIIFDALKNSTISDLDKVELMMNVDNFLRSENYDDNIKTLNIRRLERKWR